uniref:Chromatin assembly factor 1 subunit B n=1 Tax=Aceria tosichella TaxID=561515 RepID=A0A6G1SP02_9ACAR
MRVHTPEISWHNRLPTLALDVAPQKENGNYRVATGGNDCRVYIWTINPKTLDIRIRAGLRRHQKSVGTVRFSPQQLLASGDDDGYIYLWKQKVDENQQHHQVHFQQPQQHMPTADSFLNDDDFEDLETWQHHKVLRGHIEDVCDLTWSGDGKYLLSGSVDNSAILWDTNKGIKIWCSDLIKGYVQGVAIDPHFEFMAVLSTDRTLRVYNFEGRKLLSATRRANIKNKYKVFFSDDTVQTFCRRFEFSPDGQFLIAPTSRLAELEKSNPKSSNNESATGQADNGGTEQQQITSSATKPSAPSKPTNVFLVFKRKVFNKPFLYYPVGREVALCVRFSPIVYKLRNVNQNFWGIPYRIVFAVATTRSVLIYDSQQSTPIAYVSQIHLARLTDLSWSQDGRMLMVSSYDGYTSSILFDKEEIGEIYTESLWKPVEEVEPPPKPEPKLPTPKKAPEPMTIRKYLIKRS